MKSSDGVGSTAQTKQEEEQAIDTEIDGRQEKTLHRPHVRAWSREQGFSNVPSHLQSCQDHSRHVMFLAIGKENTPKVVYDVSTEALGSWFKVFITPHYTWPWFKEAFLDNSIRYD
jgi:hypothetical protein